MKLKGFMIALAMTLAFAAQAQEDFRHSIDTDLHALRNCVVPGFHYSYDDYLQYAPAALTLGLKACGYESRSGWGRMIVSDAFSAAIMAGAVNGLKYSVGRLRPDGSRRNSFPSGHTATAFMTATMLHKEYGWRSPWFSIGGYTTAAVTGISRILNNRHWLSDVIAGGAIGIGSVHLGYFITDCIFKEKGLYDGYVDPEFYYNPAEKHYVAELVFGRRFILGGAGYKAAGTLPVRGSLAGLSADVPLAPGTGLTARASSSSLTFESSEVIPLYSTMAGGFYNFHFAKILELQVKAMAGYAWSGRGYLDSEMVDMATGKSGGDITDGVRVPSLGAGVALGAGIGLSLITDNNFKIKAFADYELSGRSSQPWLNSVIIGYSAAWFW